MSAIETCSVCGRTILAGERTRTYLTPDREPRVVCELCRARAEHLGWVWEEQAGERAPAPARRRRGARLGALLRGREQRHSAVEESPAKAAQPDGASSVPEQPRTSPDPAAPGARVGRAAVPETPLSRFEQAIWRFNAGAESRTVAGLMRTLGSPWISIGSAAGSPSEVRITVAWELCWYQWGVDLRDELRPVYQIDQGVELAELDASARQWNASAEAGGQLAFGAPAPEEPAPDQGQAAG